ncbi:hypothetical protein ACFQL7_27630 [Halocatena marina]|uniref:DUF4190 domain-containing protein n=1 Tax=Halocatena marina TaxID=2934937 RepID=A0ABD5YVS7_9EURY
MKCTRQSLDGGQVVLTALVVVALITQPILLFAQPVAAQDNSSGNGNGNGNGGGDGGTSPSDFASSVCNSAGYNLILGIAYVIVALAFVGLIVGGLVGAGLLSIGWVGRTIGTIAKRMITGSIGGVIIMLLIITILGIAIANVSLGIPESCTWFLS